MADVTIKYNGSTIAELDGKGSKTLKTAGTYCEGNIDVVCDASGAKNTKNYEITLAHVGGWVLLTTLDEEVLAHINDPNIVVSFMRMGEYAHTNLTTSMAIVTNAVMGYYNSQYAYYGVSHYANTATSSVFQGVFYPANDNGASTSLGGTQFKLSGNKYYIRPYNNGVNPGNYKLIFTW